MSVPRAEWNSLRNAAAASNAALDNTLASDFFDEAENATASEKLLAALHREHPKGDVHAR